MHIFITESSVQKQFTSFYILTADFIVEINTFIKYMKLFIAIGDSNEYCNRKNYMNILFLCQTIVYYMLADMPVTLTGQKLVPQNVLLIPSHKY